MPIEDLFGSCSYADRENERRWMFWPRVTLDKGRRGHITSSWLRRLWSSNNVQQEENVLSHFGENVLFYELLIMA